MGLDARGQAAPARFPIRAFFALRSAPFPLSMVS